MTKYPRSVFLALALIFVNVLIWLGFGVIVTANLHPALPNSALVKALSAALAFTAAGALLICLMLLARRSKTAYFSTLGLLGISSLLTIFDEFGLADLVVLIFNLAPIILLIMARTWFLPTTLKPNKSI